MSVNEQMKGAATAENSSPERKEGDIIPLQRCPHLYIKYTAAKGNNAISLFLLQMLSSPRRQILEFATPHSLQDHPCTTANGPSDKKISRERRKTTT